MKKILIVDDVRGAREVLIYSLNELGLTEIVAAGSGQEALEKFIVGEFALVISDVEMPGMDGFTLARSILEQDPEQPIFLMSSELKYADTAQKNSIHFLAKGYGPMDLQRAIEDCLHS
ncbi:MAG: response regulator [Patescibacteria group bacterium]